MKKTETNPIPDDQNSKHQAREMPKLPSISRHVEQKPNDYGEHRFELPKDLRSECVKITAFDYGPNNYKYSEIVDLEKYLKTDRSRDASVRWINIDGIDGPTLQTVMDHYELHPLAVEDVINISQRPKIDTYQNQLFILARELMIKNDHLHSEQISIFLVKGTIITIQESEGDVFNRVREKIKKEGSRVRENDASFLLYALVGSLVDHCFPVIEHFSEALEQLEEKLLEQPEKQHVGQIHEIKREMLILRRAVWPMRDLIHLLSREDHILLSSMAKTYMRDVYDHIIQVIDVIESYREMTVELNEIYLGSLSQKMNEIMKVLALFTAIFSPVTFLAGVYGMNFRHQPEFEWDYGYLFFWILALIILVGMFIWFKKKCWI